MRILLIRPNSKLRSTFPPIGLGYIADSVRKAGHEVSILDARLERLPPDRVLDRVREAAPDVIGTTGIHRDFEKQGVRELALALKRAGASCPIVLGGPLVSTSGEELVRDGIVDVAVLGEGETPFNQYLGALTANEPIDPIPGLIFLKDGHLRSNPPASFLTDLDDCVPAWDLIQPQRYFSIFCRSTLSMIKRSRKSVAIFTSRGCPYRCTYCHNTLGKKFRPRSVEAVLAEIVMLKRRYGIRELEIVDDCFNVDRKRAKDIARGIIDLELDLAISFPNGIRADLMDEELIDLLAEAGTYQIVYAVETASPRLQRLIKKNLDLARAEEVIAYTADRGIFTRAYFMMGFPTETEEELRMTLDFALRSKFHAAYFFYVNPIPGTELAKAYPLDEAKLADLETMNYFELRVNMSEVPDETLRRINKEAYRRFHFSPRRIWRTFQVTPKSFRTVWGAAVVTVLGIKDTSNW